ncbi:MAG: ATP-binding cassette domain-containing protein, partial [Bradyrhizobium sp.]|nr:ATP-binding cassette domain-containing protein [Bradyrhizobium sp.]
MGRITLEGVQKSFGPVHIIKGADLDIPDGAFVVFVGPSGCGKTTLLRLIAGLEDVSGGRILIDGHNVVDVPPAKRGLSMVFQSYALYPHMSVRGNIAFGLKMAGLPKAEINQKVEAAAATLNLTPYLDRKPRELSGGQRQRVAIGRAIVREPKAFLFDEPLSNLDAALRVLIAGGYRVYVPRPVDGGRALCCGRTFLSAGLVDEAKSELQRLVETYAPFAARGVPIIGLEPSCLLTLRDELLSLRNDANARTISAHALLLEEFLAREAESGRLALPLGPLPGKALLHGHCHQKSFAAFKPVEQVLRLIPELEVETIESSCCGMAGA